MAVGLEREIVEAHTKTPNNVNDFDHIIECLDLYVGEERWRCIELWRLGLGHYMRWSMWSIWDALDKSKGDIDQGIKRLY